MEDTLIHYGVKGMKWGVRRYQGYDGKLTALGKRRKLQGKQTALSENPDGSYSLKKGTVVQRISDVKNETPRGSTYVSFTPYDNASYDDFFATKLQNSQVEQTMDSKIYRHTLTTTKELRFPSRDTASDVFIKQMKSNPEEYFKIMGNSRRLSDFASYPIRVTEIMRKRLDSSWGDTLYQRGYNFYTSRYKDMTVSQLKNDAFLDFMNAIAESEAEGLKKSFISELSRNGYDGVIDYNDSEGLGTRGGYGSEAPLIIFNTSENLTPKSSELIRSGGRDYAADWKQFKNEFDGNKTSKNDNEYDDWLRNELRRRRGNDGRIRSLEAKSRRI